MSYSVSPGYNNFDATLPGSSVPPGLGNSAPNSPNNVPVALGTTTFGYLNPQPIQGTDGPFPDNVTGNAFFAVVISPAGCVTLTMDVGPDGDASYPYVDCMGAYLVKLDSSAFKAVSGWNLLQDSFKPLGATVLAEMRDGALWFYVPPWKATAVLNGPVIYTVELLAA
jgi:hypothetical protein